MLKSPFTRATLLVVVVAPLSAIAAAACTTAPSSQRSLVARPSSSRPLMTASGSSSTDQAAPPAPPVATIPTLVMEKLGADGPRQSLFAIEGALMIAEDQRVGRLVDDNKIEWVGKIPPNSGFGKNFIRSVHGRWPDGVDVFFESEQGRAPAPTYFPLTGKGVSHTFAPGGGAGIIHGLATVGGSTLLGGWSSEFGNVLLTVRGPKVKRVPLTPAQAGCKKDEVQKFEFAPMPPAISPQGFGGTAAGTLVSVGYICEQRGPGAEVWDENGKSKIVDLGHLLKKPMSILGLLRGSGDELWILSRGWSRHIHYRNGQFEGVPDLDKPTQSFFVSPRGQLHATDGERIYRLEGEANKWVPVARLSQPIQPTQAWQQPTIAIDAAGTFWAESSGKIYKLRDGGTTSPAQEECKTPFVYLYEVAYSNAKDFTFPTTRKALSTFANVSELELVEVSDGGPRQLGVKVSSKAQGEAVIAHVKSTMKDEDPRLFCFAPKSARKIEMKP